MSFSGPSYSPSFGKKLNVKSVIHHVAIGGSIINVAFASAQVVGDIIKGNLGLDSLLNLLITAAIMYLVVNYDLAEVVVGWLLLIGAVLSGLMMMKVRK